MMKKIEIGIFAHNEEKNIEQCIKELYEQNLFNVDKYAVKVRILANGCTDNTYDIASQYLDKNYIAKNFKIENIAESGKSNTWNLFVHTLVETDVDFIVFCDSDISFSDPGHLRRLLTKIEEHKDLQCVTSRPVKDIELQSGDLTLVERLIAKSAGDRYNWKNSIAGSLYAMRLETAQSFHLPIGLPVEDGFVRAMVLTHVFSQPENLSLIEGVDGGFHVYESERTLSGLVRHQTRIFIGNAVNAAVFDYLRLKNPLQIKAALADSAKREEWLKDVINNQLPNRRHGYIPISAISSRFYRFKNLNENNEKLKKFPTLVIGIVFDTLVFINAQIKMMRGIGAGYW